MGGGEGEESVIRWSSTHKIFLISGFATSIDPYRIIYISLVYAEKADKAKKKIQERLFVYLYTEQVRVGGSS